MGMQTLILWLVTPRTKQPTSRLVLMPPSMDTAKKWLGHPKSALWLLKPSWTSTALAAGRRCCRRNYRSYRRYVGRFPGATMRSKRTKSSLGWQQEDVGAPYTGWLYWQS